MYVDRIMQSILVAVMGTQVPDRRRLPVYHKPKMRSRETVERLMEEAVAKRIRKNQKRKICHYACIGFNPCYKIGKPSQKFLDYMPVRGRNGIVMMPIHPERQ